MTPPSTPRTLIVIPTYNGGILSAIVGEAVPRSPWRPS